MEHKQTTRHNIFKLLPKVVSSVSFQNPCQFSPGRDHNVNKPRTKGAIVSIVPVEARRKSWRGEGCLYQPQEEPKSPKISCMGQIQQLKEKQKAQKEKKKKLEKQTSSTLFPKKVHHVSKIKTMFSVILKGEKKSRVLDRAPTLTKMKRFASGRNHGIADFDWTAPEESGVRDSYKSQHRDRGFHNEQEIFSAPTTVVNGIAIRPKKEINLWKRRTMNPPPPLDLD